MNQFQSFSEVMAALRRRKAMILFIVIIGSVLSVLNALGMTKMYEATAVVQIEEARIPDAMAGTSGEAEDASLRLRLIEQRLMARDNVVAIMDKHGIYADQPDMSLNERVAALREAVRIVEIRDDSPSWQRGAASGLYITAQVNNPQKAADLANELALSLVEQSARRAESRVRETFDFFVDESERVEADIVAIEDRIASFKQENAEVLPEGIAALRVEGSSLREAALRLEQEIITLQSNADRQREEVLERQVALLEEQKALIAERLTQIDAQIRRAPEVERALGTLERELTRLQEQYTVITRRKAEAEMGQMLEDRAQSDRFEILETALVPEFSVSRSRKRTALMGAVASIIVAVGAAFLIELRNPAIRNSAQMERVLGMQPVVSIPQIRSRGDVRKRRIALGATLLTIGLAVFAAVRFLGEKFWQLGLDRILPRLTQS
ncbi:chain-length determining protein [Thalassococcus sp. BH17M4-6]|uniref:chain-length determining protein n=1 Tax=Thalassococcus sp. BH17M4-6 TaxID=3413148 RepID=UPI003BDEADCE